jgi:hypothetical protein
MDHSKDSIQSCVVFLCGSILMSIDQAAAVGTGQHLLGASSARGTPHIRALSFRPLDTVGVAPILTSCVCPKNNLLLFQTSSFFSLLGSHSHRGLLGIVLDRD